MEPACQSCYEPKLRKGQSQNYESHYPKMLRENMVSREIVILRLGLRLCCLPMELRAKTKWTPVSATGYPHRWPFAAWEINRVLQSQGWHSHPTEPAMSCYLLLL